jgi:plasmid stabilization system protein ParE
VPRLIYLASARRDLVSIFEHITRESGSVAVGKRFVEQLRQQCAKLASLPGTLGQTGIAPGHPQRALQGLRDLLPLRAGLV